MATASRRGTRGTRIAGRGRCALVRLELGRERIIIGLRDVGSQKHPVGQSPCSVGDPVHPRVGGRFELLRGIRESLVSELGCIRRRNRRHQQLPSVASEGGCERPQLGSINLEAHPTILDGIPVCTCALSTDGRTGARPLAARVVCRAWMPAC